MKILEIPTEEIRRDFFFRFSTRREAVDLKRSIKASGIRTPLDVLDEEEGFRLLAGFKRFETALEIGMRLLPVRLHDRGSDAADLLRQALLEHRTERAFNLVEKARIVAILDHLKVPAEAVAADFLSLLELHGRREILDEIKCILTYTESVHEYIEKHDLSLKQSSMFRRLNPDEQDACIRMANRLRMRSVELSGVMGWILDISDRDGIPALEILNSRELTELTEDEVMTRNEKLLRLKRMMVKRRYPRLHAYNEKLEKWSEDLKLPAHSRISWDRSLERPGIALEARISSPADYDAIRNFLSDLDTRECFESMFTVV